MRASPLEYCLAHLNVEFNHAMARQKEAWAGNVRESVCLRAGDARRARCSIVPTSIIRAAEAKAARQDGLAWNIIDQHGDFDEAGCPRTFYKRLCGNKVVRIVVVGSTNAGKSTLANNLVSTPMLLIKVPIIGGTYILAARSFCTWRNLCFSEGVLDPKAP